MRTNKSPQHPAGHTEGEEQDAYWYSHPYATDLTNATLMQTDFARIERRQRLRRMQARLARKEAFIGWFRQRAALYRELYWTCWRQGPWGAARHTLFLLQREWEAQR